MHKHIVAIFVYELHTMNRIQSCIGNTDGILVMVLQFMSVSIHTDNRSLRIHSSSASIHDQLNLEKGWAAR